jgi:hypothetical protein
MTAPKQINNIGLKESALLCNLIETEYPELALTDNQFAVYATEKLGFTVSGTHVHNRRKAYGIPSFITQPVKLVPEPLQAVDPEDRITALENKILQLEKVLNKISSYFTLMDKK